MGSESDVAIDWKTDFIIANNFTVITSDLGKNDQNTSNNTAITGTYTL